jgi:hypothetical protein
VTFILPLRHGSPCPERTGKGTSLSRTEGDDNRAQVATFRRWDLSLLAGNLVKRLLDGLGLDDPQGPFAALHGSRSAARVGEARAEELDSLAV